MKIKYLRVRNFLSIGREDVEIDFTKLGNIVNIKGHNLDAGNGASNAAGKSTLLNSIVYGFYGKLIKGLNHKEAINIRTKKNLEVEIHWDDYRLIRRRAPDRLQLWKGDEDISLGGIPATDELIRNTIRLNCNSFVNVACFGQHNIRPFLSCDPSEKRQIAENLLSLDRYLKYNKAAKERVKANRERHGQLSYACQSMMQDLKNNMEKVSIIKDKQKKWLGLKKEELSRLEEKSQKIRENIAVLKKKELESKITSQDEINSISEDITSKEKVRQNLHVILDKAETAIQQKRDDRQNLAIELSRHDRDLAMAKNDLQEIEKSSEEFKQRKGGFCPECHGQITEQNVKNCLERNLQKARECKVRWEVAAKEREETAQKLSKCEETLSRLMEGRKQAKEKEIINLNSLNLLIQRRKELELSRPDFSAESLLLSRDLEHVNDRMKSVRMEPDPYESLMRQSEEDLKSYESKIDSYRSELESLNVELPYYEFWVKAFGDDGIRSFVIDEIVPALNSRINYWLQFLMDGRIQVNFDSSLNETIDRVPGDSDPFVYNSLSGGEHCRIDLAISQAFAHVMMMTSGTCPSIVALDEVGANIDRPGIQAIYKMICELATDRQVLVITHDPDLSEMLSSYDTINVVMENGFTKLRK